MRIAIDVDGGDHGAAVTLPAAAEFLASFGLHNLHATVETGGADVVTTMHLTGRWLNAQMRRGKTIVSTVHATL